MLSSLIDKVLGWSWSALRDRRRVRVLAYPAAPDGTKDVHVYIDVTNLSRQREIEVTHVWFECNGRQVAVMPEQRPLPKRLKPDEVWTTWIHRSELAPCIGDAGKLGRVRLSTGAVIKSKRNKKVVARGHVAGAEQGN